MASKITQALIKKLEDRDAVGLTKYGTTLDREDLDTIQWLTHLQEELLDGAGYIEVLLARFSQQLGRG